MQKQNKSECARGINVFQNGTKNGKRTEISTEMTTNIYLVELLSEKK